MVPEKCLGTGIAKIWYRKKVLEPVSEKFGIGKKSQVKSGHLFSDYRQKCVNATHDILMSDRWLGESDLPPSNKGYTGYREGIGRYRGS